ncbi:MAG: M42 family metallopeptidase [Syntrophomonadaceae bacterium]|nr:M42 family metallopeptidase [Syntrophomonadaceae bacterium]
MLNHEWITSINRLYTTLSKLIEEPGVTGQEDAVATRISQLLDNLPVTKRKDNLGNLIVTLNPKKTPKVMFFAHMDEIGWVVRKIDKQGYLYLYPVGGVPEHILSGQWVRVLTPQGPIFGAVVAKPPHLALEGENLPPIIDVGVNSASEAAELGICPGNPVIVERQIMLMANSQRAIGRCFDNRMGCALLIHLLHYFSDQNLDGSIVAVFSSTEEHGMSSYTRNFNLFGPGARGAWLPAHVEKPDLAFVVDTNTCSDLPGAPEHEITVQMGKGPVLRFLDDLTIIRPEMRQFMLETAVENDIPYQVGFSMAYTDASVIQLTGVPVGVIGIPLRYLHSPAQILHLPDLLHALRWAVALVNKAKDYPYLE